VINLLVFNMLQETSKFWKAKIADTKKTKHYTTF